MSEKTINASIVSRHDTTDNWASAASTFIPKSGEIVIYTDDDGSKIKIGDGVNTLANLSFITDDYFNKEELDQYISDNLSKFEDGISFISNETIDQIFGVNTEGTTPSSVIYAVINDDVTAADTTWSSSKIASYSTVPSPSSADINKTLTATGINTVGWQAPITTFDALTSKPKDKNDTEISASSKLALASDIYPSGGASGKYLTYGGDNTLTWGTPTVAEQGEISTYLKQASVSGNTLTLTTGDGNTVTYQGQGTVTSVNGETGAIVLDSDDISVASTSSNITTVLATKENTANKVTTISLTDEGYPTCNAVLNYSGSMAHTHSAAAITSGALSIGYGGTGVAASNTAAVRSALGITLENLGAATSSHTHPASVITSGTLSLSYGGTGASTASGALINLGAAATVHTHSYAGASVSGGAATTAVRLESGTIGSSIQPVYFNEGIPTACSYTIEKAVPSNADFNCYLCSTSAYSSNISLSSAGTTITMDISRTDGYTPVGIAGYNILGGAIPIGCYVDNSLANITLMNLSGTTIGCQVWVIVLYQKTVT